MSKRKKNVVFSLTAEENTLRQMPHYNAYQGGYGAHGSRKYNRKKVKRDFRKMLETS